MASEQAERMKEIARLLNAMFSTEDAAIWLNRKQPMLGAVPLHLVAEGRADLVLKCLQAIDNDTYA